MNQPLLSIRPKVLVRRKARQSSRANAADLGKQDKPVTEVTFEELAEMPLVKSYIDTFWKAMGIPLLLMPGDPAEKFVWAAPAQGGLGGSPSHRLLWELSCRTEMKPCPRVNGSSDGHRARFFPQIEVLNAPILAGGRYIASMVGGPVICGNGHSPDLAQLAHGLASRGITLGSACETVLVQTPLLHAERLQALTGLLGKVAQHIGEHLELLSGLPRLGGSEGVIAGKRFIDSHFAEALKLEQAAGAAGMTPSDFCRVFHHTTGVTFVAYLASVRVNHAKRMLRHSNVPIRQVAYASGFGSLCRFNAVFRKVTGHCPREYRQMVQR